MRATDFGSGSGGYKFGGLQDSGGYKFGGLQDCEPPILGPPPHQRVLEDLCRTLQRNRCLGNASAWLLLEKLKKHIILKPFVDFLVFTVIP